MDKLIIIKTNDRNNLYEQIISLAWLCLVAIMDWYSRYVLDWQIDDALDIGFVLEASRNALEISIPEIMNSDQGSHFTSPRRDLSWKMTFRLPLSGIVRVDV